MPSRVSFNQLKNALVFSPQKLECDGGSLFLVSIHFNIINWHFYKLSRKYINQLTSHFFIKK